ncbi:hypothetical protein OAI33_13860 [Pirellulaceae bacterium]|nr:hypothetical protein [Pirellulaceae bacterium]
MKILILGILCVLAFSCIGCDEGKIIRDEGERDISTPSRALVGHWRSADGDLLFVSSAGWLYVPIEEINLLMDFEWQTLELNLEKREVLVHIWSAEFGKPHNQRFTFSEDYKTLMQPFSDGTIRIYNYVDSRETWRGIGR